MNALQQYCKKVKLILLISIRYYQIIRKVNGHPKSIILRCNNITVYKTRK